MNQKFTKRIFTAGTFFNDLGFLLWNLPKIVLLLTSKQAPHQLIEKIFIVTDAVNGCIYCSWLDAKLAMKSGISEEEIKNMLNLEFHTNASEYELPALLYAQHYAETNRHPDPELTRELFDFYGEKTMLDIMLAIRAVTFGNLYFNTWRAAVSRFKGRPAANSNAVFEVVYFLLNFVIVLPFILLRKLDKKAMGSVDSN